MAPLLSRLRRRDAATPGVPPDLPEHLTAPVIDLDPTHDAGNRQYAAYVAFVAYQAELTLWLRANAPEYRPLDVMRALGTTMDALFQVARRAKVSR